MRQNLVKRILSHYIRRCNFEFHVHHILGHTFASIPGYVYVFIPYPKQS